MFGVGDSNIRLIRTNMSGEELWSKTYAGTDTYPLHFDKKAFSDTYLLEEDLFQLWDNNDWTNRRLEKYFYGSLGQLLIGSVKYWVESTSTWSNNEIKTYTYDQDGNNIEIIVEIWQNNTWLTLAKFSSAYDAGNKLTEFFLAFFQGDSWINEWRFLYEYYVDDNLETVNNERWINSSWVLDYSNSYTYHDDGKIYQIVTSSLFNPDIGVSGRETYTYDNVGNLIEILNESYFNDTWNFLNRQTNTYDSSSKVISEISQSWDDSNWINWSRTNYTYDTAQYLVKVDLMNWFSTSWSNSQRETYNYDEAGNLSEFINYLWDLDNNSWEYYGKHIYKHTFFDSTEEFISLPYNLILKQNYPNPFNPETTLEYTLLNPGEVVSLKIYNLLGQEVARLVSEIQQSGNHIVKWNASHLPSGIYFYRLQAGDLVQTRKMVLLK